MKLTLEPRKAVGPIKLAASQESVRDTLAAVGCPVQATHGNSDYFFESTIQVEYDEGLASFIGISAHASIELLYRDYDLFDMAAEQVFRVLSSHEAHQHHIFNETEYCQFAGKTSQ